MGVGWRCGEDCRALGWAGWWWRRRGDVGLRGGEGALLEGLEAPLEVLDAGFERGDAGGGIGGGAELEVIFVGHGGRRTWMRAWMSVYGEARFPNTVREIGAGL